MLRSIGIVVSVLLGTLLLETPAADAAPRLKPGDNAPDITLTAEDGTTLSAFGEQDTTEVLVFLRPGAYSEKALKELTTLAEELADSALRLRPIWVAMKPGGLRGTVPAGPRWYDPSRKGAAAYKVIAFPSTVVISPKRQVICFIPSRPMRYVDLVKTAVLYSLGRIDKAEHDRRVANPGEVPGEMAKGHRARAIADSAVNLARAGAKDEADSEFLRAIEMAPGDHQVHELYVEFLLDESRLEDASPLLAKLTQGGIARSTPKARILGGRLLRLQGKSKEGIEFLTRALSLTPSRKHIRLELGRCYEAIEDWKAAAEQYRLGLEEALKAPRK